MDVYPGRWGIEELYKVSKRIFIVEDFHAKTERGVKQELFAHFVLITMNRLFANRADSELNPPQPSTSMEPRDFSNDTAFWTVPSSQAAANSRTTSTNRPLSTKV